MSSKSVFLRPKNEIKILQLLLKENMLTTKEIAQKLGSSKQRINTNLRNLMKDGLVLRLRTLPRRYTYKINLIDNPVLLKFAEAFFFEKFIRLNKKLNSIPLKIGFFYSYELREKLKLAIIFGSCTREEEFNDVDLAVILDRKTEELERKVASSIYSLQTMTDYKFSVEAYGYNEFKRNLEENDELALNIMNGVPLFSSLFSKKKEFGNEFTEFVKFKFLKQFQDRYGKIVKAFVLLKEAEKKMDSEKVKDAITNFIYYILGKEGTLPSNDHEAMRIFKKRHTELYNKFPFEKEEKDLTKKDAKKFKELLMNYVIGNES